MELNNLIAPVQAQITAHLGEFGPIFLIGILGVALVGVALPYVMLKPKDPLDRIRNRQREEMAQETPFRLRRSGKDERLNRFAQYLEPQDQQEYSAARLQLVRAGYLSMGAVQLYHFAQFALGIAGLVLGIILVLFSGAVTAQDAVLMVLIPSGLGYYGPKYWVQRRVQARMAEISSGFPDALDLMLVCVEAGQSLDQSIIRVAREMRAGYPSLSEEFDIVAFEMKAGKDKVRVLRDFSERVGIQDVSSFVTTLIQSATFGTSIAEALRVYAEEMRHKRVMRAEEKASALPTKLTLGTMVFCLPPLLVILIGPSVYGVVMDLQNGM
ncbi:type II secretion system F family protein [Rhodobacterales bacterium LSUCC0031]|nr:type II secretion system F family protein [Rhodobacterales bacterium LSUCC0031]